MTEPTRDEHSDSVSTSEELEHAREVLARQLEVVCATPINPTSGETTGQLSRLDDALLAAARTAKEMIALKQKVRAEREVRAATPASGTADDAHVERIREFHDRNGCKWRAWAVIPGQGSTGSTRNLGDLRDGWLAFESMSGSGKRRLARFPADWMTLSDADLESLLESASDAPARKHAASPDSASPD